MNDAAPRHSIRDSLLRALLGVALVTAITFAGVSLTAVKYIGKLSLAGNVSLAQSAVSDSKSALTTAAQRELQTTATEEAALCDARLDQLKARAEALRAYATLLWHQSPAIPKAGKQTAAKSAIVHFAPNVSPASVREDIARCQQLRSFLHWVQASDAAITYAEIATASGVYAYDPDRGEAPQEYGLDSSLTPYPSSAPTPPSKSSDPRQRIWYRDTLSATGAIWSPLYQSSITGGMGIACSAPVRDEHGRVVAVVCVHTSISDLEKRVLNSRLDGGEAILIHLIPDGATRRLGIIAMADTHTITESNHLSTEQRFFRFDADEKAQQQLVADVDAGRGGLIPSAFQKRSVFFQKRSVFVAYAPVTNKRWAVLILLPVDQINQPIQAVEQKLKVKANSVDRDTVRYIGNVFLILSFLFMSLIGVIAMQASRVACRIVAPIQTLDRGAQVLASGDLDYRVEIHSRDEIEHLADTFNTMASSIKQYTVSLAETVAAKERIESELALASQIQHALLPRIYPPFPHRLDFSLFASMDPAKEVGGDFYDFFLVDDTHLCFLIGDVSDKGVPAALYMMVVKTMLRTDGMRALTPDRILYHVNNELAPDDDNGMFATVFCAVLNTETGEMQVSNAGHNPPLLCTSAEVSFMPLPPGFVLGPMPNSPYGLATFTLAPGDLIFLYTDGVTEAKDPASKLFGNQRLKACIEANAHADVETVIHQVSSAVQTFAAGTQQFDDITMLALRYAGPKPNEPAHVSG